MSLVIERTVDISSGLQTMESLRYGFYTGESGAHTFLITAEEDGETATLSGTVTGKFLRADGTTQVITGEIVSGKASVTLTQACYAVPGAFIFSLYVSADGATDCLYCGRGTVTKTLSSVEVDGGTVISDLTALLTAAGTLQTELEALEDRVEALEEG